jgi:hypothetical protein
MMKSRVSLFIAALFLCFGALQMPAFAARRGGGGFHEGFDHGSHAAIHGDFDHDFHGGFRGGFDHGSRGRILIAPSLGFGWGFGWGYPWYWDNPWYWNPYYYSGPNVLEPNQVDYGTVEFKVKPTSTKVYVDGKFLGTVNDLDHHKAYMPGGYHSIKLVAPDGKTVDRSVYVAAGKTIKIDDRL